MQTNKESGTRIDEIASGIYRISTPVPPTAIPGGFTFNQYLTVDDAPLLYHTGPRKMFPLICEAIATVIPVQSLRYIGFSHYEADECGSLNDFLEAAPEAEPLCSSIAKMVSVDDIALRPAHALADGEELSLGAHTVRWTDTPHLPHAWECGHLFETTTKTLFCGDLFTQGGHEARGTFPAYPGLHARGRMGRRWRRATAPIGRALGRVDNQALPTTSSNVSRILPQPPA